MTVTALNGSLFVCCMFECTLVLRCRTPLSKILNPQNVQRASFCYLSLFKQDSIEGISSINYTDVYRTGIRPRRLSSVIEKLIQTL